MDDDLVARLWPGQGLRIGDAPATGSLGRSTGRISAMEIRERDDDDFGELVTVAGRVHASDGYPIFLPDGDLARFLRSPKAIAAWVALHDGRIIGHVALNGTTSQPVMEHVASLGDDRPARYVARLLTDPNARRGGVGRALLDRARRAAVDSGHVPMLDVVDTPAAAGAIALYRREGWEEVGRVKFRLVDADVDELVFRGPTS